MRDLTARLLLVALLGLLLPGAALAQVYTNTFGGTTTNSSSSSSRAKLNQYVPSQDCTLTELKIWMGSTSTVNVGVWEEQGSSFVSIWQGTLNPGSSTRAWRSVTPNVALTGGTEYAIGIHWGSGTTAYYSFSSSSTYSTLPWGSQVDWDDYTTVSATYPTTFPSSAISGVNTAGGYYQELTINVNSDSDNDGWTTGQGDCNDNDPTVFPGATEVCDGQDNNCDNVLPPNEADDDFDGVALCEGDCDDGDATSYPNAPELCDGADNDCDSQVDEGISPDDDADGYTALGACLGTANDCDDNDNSVYPGATEVCDGADNDCNGSTDEGLSWDMDSDGVTAPGSCEGTANDCDDNDPFSYPGALEICDGADNDCNGTLVPGEMDPDGDGYLGCDDDCDDTDASVNPGATEDCGNGVDDNCNGTVDEDVDIDGDGYGTCEDCNDNNAQINPGANEAACDFIDNDCDGELHPDEVDEDEDGEAICEGDCDDANPDTNTGADEICDGEDNDCDGDIPAEEDDCGDDDDDTSDDDDDDDSASTGDDDDDDNDDGGGGSGRRSTCDASGGDAPTWLGLALLGGLIGVRRRR